MWYEHRVLRLQAGHKYCLLGKLSSEVGWNHYDTIKASTFEAFCTMHSPNFMLGILLKWFHCYASIKSITVFLFGNILLYTLEIQ